MSALISCAVMVACAAAAIYTAPRTVPAYELIFWWAVFIYSAVATIGAAAAL